MIESIHGTTNSEKIGFFLKDMSFGSSLKTSSLESQKSQPWTLGCVMILKKGNGLDYIENLLLFHKTIQQKDERGSSRERTLTCDRGTSHP
jgi:hypothetical protein